MLIRLSKQESFNSSMFHLQCTSCKLSTKHCFLENHSLDDVYSLCFNFTLVGMIHIALIYKVEIGRNVGKHLLDLDLSISDEFFEMYTILVCISEQE